MFCPLLIGSLALVVPAPAAPLHERIDRLIALGQGEQASQAAPRSSDEEFLRRATLDLNGTIPSTDDIRKFTADTSAGKRAKAIDRLLANPNYARRMAQHFDVVLMERRKDTKVPRVAWEDYLKSVFAANRPYDEFVREMLAADGVDPKTRPAAKFLLDRDLEQHLATRDLSRIFLGRNLQCCQCHDHPHVESLKQAEYYGLYAYLSRSYLHPTAKAPGAVIAEKADGEVTFVSVFDKTMKQGMTNPKLPDAKTVAEPKPEKGKEYLSGTGKDVRLVPAFSRRALLPDAVATVENKAFVRTAANRLWAMMMGRGIVHPLDADHSDNPPSHPELLNLLGKEFAAQKFDVKWLLREIALSEAYQRSSQVPKSFESVSENRYLVAILKPLSPEQLAQSLGDATSRPANIAAFRNAFAGQPGEPEDGKTTTLDQTLFLKHGAVIRDGFTLAKPGNLADRLSKLKDDAVADELFLAVLSRKPSESERTDILAMLKENKDRPAICGELVWALLASGEFRFNH
jgi:hypothetical protein